MVKCSCGCGEEIPLINKLGKSARFKHGHNRRGAINSEEHRRKTGVAQLGEKNHYWRGDIAKYQAKHIWARRYLSKPDGCESCGSTRLLQWHNISKQYKRERNDWECLCCKCHMLKDGRMHSNLKQYQKTR